MKIGVDVVVPVVQRVAPKLPIGGEAIGGAASNTREFAVAVGFEHIGCSPQVARVGRHVNGHIANDFNPFAVGVGFHFAPLRVKEVLHRLVVVGACP